MTTQFNAVGVPPLLNKINNVANIAILLTADALLIAQKITAFPKWGIFFSGGFVTALDPDSVISLGYKKEYSIPQYPMELGAFQSYNKVTEPYDVKVRMTISDSSSILSVFGANTRIGAFLKDVVAASNSLTLYDIVTPDATYTNANIYHYDYNRTATNGVGMLTVDLYLKEIRATISPAFSNTASPTSSSAVSSTATPQSVTALTGNIA